MSVKPKKLKSRIRIYKRGTTLIFEFASQHDKNYFACWLWPYSCDKQINWRAAGLQDERCRQLRKLGESLNCIEMRGVVRKPNFEDN